MAEDNYLVLTQMRGLVERAIDDIEAMLQKPSILPGLTTGITKLDRRTLGLQRGHLYVIAGRPSSGKTSLALNILDHIAVDLKLPCALFSLNMTSRMMMLRLLTSRARVSLQDISRGILSKRQTGALTQASRELKQAPISIHDNYALNISELRESIPFVPRHHPKDHTIRLIVIDGLQQLACNFRDRDAKRSFRTEIEIISAELKKLAVDLRVPVLVTAQLDYGEKPDQRPSLFDLGDSIPAVKYADTVALLARSSPEMDGYPSAANSRSGREKSPPRPLKRPSNKPAITRDDFPRHRHSRRGGARFPRATCGLPRRAGGLQAAIHQRACSGRVVRHSHGVYKVPVEAAAELILGLAESIAVEALSLADYQKAIREARRRGVMGGGIYDSLHATFARRKKAGQIVTRNPSHFVHVAPDMEILTP